MKSPIIIILISILSIFLTRCTIEKRLYNKGFYIEWKKRFQAPKSYEILENERFDEIQFTPQEFSTTDSIIEIPQAKQVVSENSIDQQENEQQKKDPLIISPTSPKVRDHALIRKLKDEGENVIKKPINKKLLISALIFGFLFLSSLILLILSNSGVIPSAIIFNFLVFSFGFIAFILFAKLFYKEPILDDKDVQNEQKTTKSKFTYKQKKNGALVVTIFFLLTLAIVAFAIFTLASDPFAIGALFAILLFGLIAIILLFVSIILWTNASDAKNAELNGEPEAKEVGSNEPKKNRIWIILIFIAVGGAVILFDKFS